MTSSRLVVYCLLMCSHLRCHDLFVVPWTATFMVLWPFLLLIYYKINRMCVDMIDKLVYNYM